MAAGSGIDVLVVGLDSTGGWTNSTAELVAGLRRAGASAEGVGTGPVPRVRTFALTDFAQAWLARRAAARAITAHEPRAVIYLSITAALLWPRPGAISVDSIAAENRPGRHGIWQRPVERRRLRQAPLVMAWSDRTLAALAGDRAPTVIVPFPIELPPVAELPGVAARDIDVLTYAGDPVKRRLDYLLEVWAGARREGERLVVAGLEGFNPPAGVDSVGRLGRDEFRALLRRARAFAAAPRREDYGISALEALAAGCQLVTTESLGPYPARELARSVDPRLVGEDLAGALRLALDDPLPGYAARAAELLVPYARETVDRSLARDVLPRLLPGWAG
jgi:glycosyltransferase involved in cell wall biosynthesis